MKPLKVDKLSDEFGQYEILLKCGACGHSLQCYPNTLAGIRRLGCPTRRCLEAAPMYEVG